MAFLLILSLSTDQVVGGGKVGWGGGGGTNVMTQL